MVSNSSYILSICIPTYNRSIQLKQCIDSIVCQKDFLVNNQVEIIVCDNFSDDNTKSICKDFESRFGGNFKYYCNNVNIGAEKNYEKTLSLGNGDFLKLSNDTNFFIEGSLNYILKSLKENKQQDNFIYFSNNLFKNESKIVLNNLDEFIKKISFYSTWILYYGVYKKKFNEIKSFEIAEKTHLINDVLYQNIINSNKIIIYNEPIIKLINPKIKKGPYNFFEVFIANYLNILKFYMNKGYVKNKTLFIEKHKLMLNHILPFSYLIFVSKKVELKTDGFLKIIFKYYFFHPVLYYGLFVFFIKKLLNKMKH